MWPKICSSFLLCWGLEFMKLKNLVLLQLHLAPPLLGEVYCMHQETVLCDQCHPLLNLWPCYSHKHISWGTVRYSFFHCILKGPYFCLLFHSIFQNLVTLYTINSRRRFPLQWNEQDVIAVVTHAVCTIIPLSLNFNWAEWERETCLQLVRWFFLPTFSTFKRLTRHAREQFTFILKLTQKKFSCFNYHFFSRIHS